MVVIIIHVFTLNLYLILSFLVSREETVIALIKLGGAPGAVEDPTSTFPQGRTAADLASSRGHKGIAAYLAEADLTGHLWTVNENEIDIIAANKAGDSAFEIARADSSNVTMPEQRFLKESLAVLRKSAHAAALIQAAFKARSFRRRQLINYTSDIPEIALNLVAVGSLNKVQRMSHFEVHLHSAALKIQKRYRGWKGRREFSKIRNRIVKIQVLYVCTLYYIVLYLHHGMFTKALTIPCRPMLEDTKLAIRLFGQLALWRRQYSDGGGEDLVCEDSELSRHLELWLQVLTKVMNMNF